jgi:hypothetical protein
MAAVWEQLMMSWTADGSIPTADSGLFTADGFQPNVTPPQPPSTVIQPDGYNIYVNGVFNQFVLGYARRLCTITGLSANVTYQIKITIVSAGVEAAESDQLVTLEPTSVMTTTPMKRIQPFGAMPIN